MKRIVNSALLLFIVSLLFISCSGDMDSPNQDPGNIDLDGWPTDFGPSYIDESIIPEKNDTSFLSEYNMLEPRKLGLDIEIITTIQKLLPLYEDGYYAEQELLDEIWNQKTTENSKAYNNGEISRAEYENNRQEIEKKHQVCRFLQKKAWQDLPVWGTKELTVSITNSSLESISFTAVFVHADNTYYASNMLTLEAGENRIIDLHFPTSGNLVNYSPYLRVYSDECKDGFKKLPDGVPVNPEDWIHIGSKNVIGVYTENSYTLPNQSILPSFEDEFDKEYDVFYLEYITTMDAIEQKYQNNEISAQEYDQLITNANQDFEANKKQLHIKWQAKEGCWSDFSTTITLKNYSDKKATFFFGVDSRPSGGSYLLSEEYTLQPGVIQDIHVIIPTYGKYTNYDTFGISRKD